VNYCRNDILLAGTLSAIFASTVLIIVSMTAFVQPMAPPASYSVVALLEHAAQPERSDGARTEEKTSAAFTLPLQKANTTNDQVRMPLEIVIGSVSSNDSSSEKTSITYVSGGGGGGGGGGSGGSSDKPRGDKVSEEDETDVKPTPKPAPKPDPKPKPDDDPLPSRELHGVNFIDPVLNRKEGKPKLSKQTDFVDEFVAKAKESNFNVFRIPVKWEAYVDNKGNFLAELDYLVKTANENDISVWIDFHHFYATSNWGSKVAKGDGFPKFVVSCYKPTKSYERDPEVRAFWNDYYLNKVRDSSNSCKRTLDVWTLQADFMKDMINEVDDYRNVLGYELLNEPHLWKDADYENLGTMHTELAEKLRKSTDKPLIFTRETTHGLEPDGSKYTRKVELEHKILPKDPAKNVIYAPHLYGLKDIEKQVATWKAVQKKWASIGYDVEIAVGEWSTQPPQLPKGKAVTQKNMDEFVKVWSREGYMHVYWAFGCFSCGEGNVLVKKGGALEDAGRFYENSIIKHYKVRKLILR
jgi:aryl-phospho-beta-D-glucosidase BglC (GH1 family)